MPEPHSVDGGRPLTGARIETDLNADPGVAAVRSPLAQGRGSKRSIAQRAGADSRGRPLTGARIETPSARGVWRCRAVAPSQGRGSKLIGTSAIAGLAASPPHRGADRNVRSPLARGRDHRVAPSQGRGSKLDKRRILARAGVAPSQGRGSKPHLRDSTTPTRSPPHRGADRNVATMAHALLAARSPPHRGADRNHDDRACVARQSVAPSQGRGSKHRRPAAEARRSPPHRGADRNTRGEPAGSCGSPLSQGRGSKHLRPSCSRRCRRPLTGARIETTASRRSAGRSGRPSHRGADRNTHSGRRSHHGAGRPSHRGADRNTVATSSPASPASPLAQGRGSKQSDARHMRLAPRVAPRTGARIETPGARCRATPRMVAPSQGRGSKRRRDVLARLRRRRPSHRGADRNSADWPGSRSASVAPLTGARIETSYTRARSSRHRRPSTGARIETSLSRRTQRRPNGRPLTGARIETT